MLFFYIFFKKVKTNKEKPIKNINQLNTTIWKKNNIKLFENKTLIFSTPIQLAFQTTFSHWSIYIKIKIIFILFIKNVILWFWLFKIHLPLASFHCKKLVYEMTWYMYSWMCDTCHIRDLIDTTKNR